MSSVTNCVGILKRVLVSEGTFPYNRDHKEIRQILSRREHPMTIERWHARNMCWVKTETKSSELERLCENVSHSLLKAAETANALQLLIEATYPVSNGLAPRHLLKVAIGHIIAAFQHFDIVAQNSEKMAARHIMDMVRIYLGEVYGLAVILGSLADPDGWFEYWAELREDTELVGFFFDSAAFYQESLLNNRTVDGVLSQLNATPSTCLPVHPTPPVLGRGTGLYSRPVLRNLRWMEELPINTHHPQDLDRIRGSCD